MSEPERVSCGETEEPYMTRHQLDQFKDRLLSWRNELSLNLTRADQADQQETENPADWIDTASQQTQADLTWAERQRIRQVIREINAALERIRLGTYGYCCETGEEIGIRRLNAMPIAKLSFSAQKAREQRQRHYR